MDVTSVVAMVVVFAFLCVAACAAVCVVALTRPRRTEGQAFAEHEFSRTLDRLMEAASLGLEAKRIESESGAPKDDRAGEAPAPDGVGIPSIDEVLRARSNGQPVG